MSLDSRPARLVRRLTRRTGALYHWLSSLHQDMIAARERRWLRRHYPEVAFVRYSQREISAQKENGFRAQFGQDHFLVHSGLLPPRGGRFIEIGCNDPELGSNSWYLEKHLAFQGLAIDPLGQYAAQWRQRRPGSTFVEAFISSRTTPVPFAETHGGQGWESMLSGASESVSVEGKNVQVTTREVHPQSLQAVLDAQRWDFGVDVLFVDVEGHEAEVLESAHWGGRRPGVLLIENTGTQTRQAQLRSRVEGLGYRLVARISIYDDVHVADATEGVAR
ncbi:MAG: hypothetical protein HKN58_07650 [Xanthomonadales bacterium]|nr:hypothetical protein [Xanthomonadales bacterium]